MSARECREKHEKKYNTYDQTVDIVSCWEAFLNYSYNQVFEDYYFDRFPTLDTNGDAVTPDFAVTVNNEYGLIGEIKRTFPEEERAFQKTLEQIERYDEPQELLCEPDDVLTPDTCDILLLISGTSAPKIGMRIQQAIDNGKLNIDRNLVVIRYQYNTRDQLSRYEFQRVIPVEQEFRDSALRDEHALSHHMGEEADYQTLPLYPKHFKRQKVKKPICNDKPPEQYLATILWHKIFPRYLDDSDFEEWRSGSAQKTIEIRATPAEFTSELNQYMHDGRAREKWVHDALQFLKNAKLAEQMSDKFKIKFRGFVRHVGENNDQEGTAELDKLQTLGETFINRFCEYTTSDDEKVDQYS